METVKRLEPADLLAFLFALVLARQAFWLLPNGAGWLAAGGLALGLASARLRSRSLRAPLPRAFWLIVGAPILVFWALHLAYPDVGYDVLNYHLLHGDRALRGLLAIPGDFYPYYFPFLNPAPDMVAGLFRYLLGYRLGTVGSALVLLWTGAILFRALGRVLGSPRLRAVAVLWILLTEGVLWEVGNYMADLWALPLLLEALLLVLPEKEERSDPLADLPLLGLLLGAAVAFKVTNLVFAAAIGVVWLWRLVSVRPSGRTAARSVARLLLASALFVLPMAPHTLYLWWTTGSPLFPHYNALFRSPLFPPFNVIDGRFGPRTLLETLAWPIVAFLHPARYVEFASTSGRLALGFLGAFAALLLSRSDRTLRAIAVVVLVGSVLWSRGTGYQRYGVFLEVVGGMVLVLLAARLATLALEKGLAPRFAAGGFVALLAVQALAALRLAEHGDWSGRPMAYRSRRLAVQELRRLGRDRDLARELPASIRDVLPSIGGWVDAAPVTNGFMSLLAPRLPMIGLTLDPLFDVPANLARFDEALKSVEGRRLASFAFPEEMTVARTALASHGFVIEREEAFELPFFSDVKRLQVVLFLVKAPPPLPGTPLLSTRELVLRRAPARGTTWAEDERLLGAVDEPAEGATVRGSLQVRGWARRRGEDLAVTFLFDGVARDPAAFRRTPRPDVVTVYPFMGDVANAGYEATYPFTPADEGVHEIVALFKSRDGRMRHYAARKFTWKP